MQFASEQKTWEQHSFVQYLEQFRKPCVGVRKLSITKRYDDKTNAIHLYSLQRHPLAFDESGSTQLGNFVVDQDNGWIMSRNERVIVFRVKTFQAMMERLTSIAGSTVTKTLFYMMGLEVGQTAMRYSKDEVHSLGDLAKVANRLTAMYGWGRSLSLEASTRDGQAVYTCVVKGTPLSHKRTANEPVCHMMRGVVAGWLEIYLDKRAVSSVETQCAAMGHEHCVFEVKFKA